MKSDGITVFVSDENERRLIAVMTDGMTENAVFTDKPETASADFVVIVGADEDKIDKAERTATLARPISLRFLSSVIEEIKYGGVPSAVAPAVVVNGTNRTVTCGDKTARLSPKEYEVFSLLRRADGRTVSRKEIEAAVWQNGGMTNVADVTVAYLRRKLRRAFGMELIITVRGKGYIYAFGRNDNGDK